MRHHHGALFALAWLTMPVVAGAQSDAVAPGTRVRVRFDCTREGREAYAVGEPKESCRTATGTITTLSAESLMFNTGSAEQSVTPATLNQLSVYGSRGRRTGTGALIGGLTGAVLLGVAGIAIRADLADSGDEVSAGYVVLGAGVGAAGGAVLGAGIGSLIRYDRWRPVPSPWGAGRSDRPTLGLLLTPPLRSRPGVLGVTIGF